MVVGIVYTPVSRYETIYIISSIFIGASIIGYTISVISNVMDDLSKKDEDY